MPRYAAARSFVSAVAVIEAGLVGFFAVAAFSGDGLGIFRSMAIAFGWVFALTAVPAVLVMMSGRAALATVLAGASLMIVCGLWWLA